MHVPATGLVLRLFGAFELRRDGRAEAVEGRKPQALLALLASGQVYARDTLAALLWPELDQSAARGNLRTALASLRKALGESLAGASEEVYLAGEGLWVDVAAFRAALSRAAAHDHQGSRCPTCHPLLERAVALRRGPLLAGFQLPGAPDFESWLAFQREELDAGCFTALSQLVDNSRSHPEVALLYAQRMRRLRPLCERSLRSVMRLYVRLGQRREALRAFRRCRKDLLESSGALPAALTRALAGAIESGARLPGEDAAHDAGPAVWTSEPSTAASRLSLPPQPTPFIGRRQELRMLDELFAGRRMVSLLGPGGIGKTRLCLRFASLFAPRLRHGAVFVPLAGCATAEEVPRTVAEQLRKRADTAEEVAALLHRRELLLVLDNLEQLAAPCPLIEGWLAAVPGLRLLVSSRKALGCPSEGCLELRGLALPAEGQADSEAVALFLACAGRLAPGFRPSPADREAIAGLCRLLEGWPLAIELAASWVRVLDCAEILRRVRSDWQLLEGARDLPPRHRSLRAVLTSTWNELSPRERDGLAALSIFDGPFERATAERVAGVDVSLLLALVERFLVRRVGGEFRLREQLRVFAAEKLAPDRAARLRARLTEA